MSRARTTHVIRKPTGGKIPRQFAVVHVATRDVEDDPSGRTIRQEYQHGQFALARVQDHELKTWRVRDADTPAELWGQIYAACRSGQCLTLLAWMPYRELTAAGLWLEVLDGRLAVVAESELCGAESAERVPVKRAGCLICDEPPTIMVFRLPGRNSTLKILSIRNYGPDSLGDLGSDDYPLGAMRGWLQSYLTVLRDLKLGSWQNTASSQAMHGFRASYLDAELQVHADDAALAAERAALYGGRCESRYIGTVSRAELGAECFVPDVPNDHHWRRDGLVYHLDVSSLYPSCATGAMMPVKYLGKVESPAADWLAEAMEERCVVIRCEVETSEPVVPWRHDGLVLYPTGKFETILCDPEVTLARDHGAVIRPLTAWVYRGERIFSQWVKALWQARQNYRQNGQSGMESVVKRLANSLFGKFAQLGKQWTDCPDHAAGEPFDFWWAPEPGGAAPTQWRSIAWQTECLITRGEHPESMPAIAAWINSLGRVRLWGLIECAGRDHVYYYDTDSIWCGQVGFDRLVAADEVVDDQLGRLRLVDTYDEVHFRGIKNYVAGGKLVCAGAPAGAVDNGAGRMTWTAQETLMGAAQARREPQPVLMRHWSAYRGEYRHGIVSADGLVRPFRVLESEQAGEILRNLE